MLASAGRPLEDADNWLEMLSKLTSEDIKSVGRKVFIDDNMTVLEFIPLDLYSKSKNPVSKF